MRKIPVILDADTGIDDTMALLICATSSKLDVLAAVSTFGNTTIDYATQNTMDVLALYDLVQPGLHIRVFAKQVGHIRQ